MIETRIVSYYLNMKQPIYFLIRFEASYFQCFSRGISVLDIPNLSKFSIMRFYPSPEEDLTPCLVRLQRRFRERLQRSA